MDIAVLVTFRLANAGRDMVLPAMDEYLTFLRHNQWRLQDELSAAKARGKVKEARQIHKRLAKVNWQIDQIYLERDPHLPQ